MNSANNQSSKTSSASENTTSKSLSNRVQNSASEASTAQTTPKRHQPIPPPSHPRQYRAIGLIRARYQQTEKQMTQGTLITTEGTEIEAVLLGRVISLIKNHLDLDKEHLWVVYPRTKAKEDRLHVQIVGVWEPETLDKDADLLEQPSESVDDGYFSIRGEVIFYDNEKNTIVVKIKQFPRKEGDKPKFFKLKLHGTLGDKPLRRFWDLKVRLSEESLIIEEGTDLGFAQKRKPKFRKDKKKISLKPGKSRKPSATARPILQKKPKS